MIHDDYTPGYNAKGNRRNSEENTTLGTVALSSVFVTLLALDVFLIFSL